MRGHRAVRRITLALLVAAAAALGPAATARADGPGDGGPDIPDNVVCLLFPSLCSR